MPAFRVVTAQRSYDAVVERGALRRVASKIPAKAGKVFVVTTADVWGLHGPAFEQAMEGRDFEPLFFPGGEERKRLAEVEALAERMAGAGADRSSVVIAFGGGIVNDLGGFLAAVFMRGIPVIQAPTTLLAQVDAGVGGKTGANLAAGKNLVGSFHQPLAVFIDPDVLGTLPEREYRAGLYEVIKCGIIRSAPLFETLERRAEDVLAREPAVLEEIIAESVRIKAEVVTADEREGDLRRILNFGHTIGHALEAETAYARFLHGEAIAFGMRAALHLSHGVGLLDAKERDRMLRAVSRYGPIPPLDGIERDNLLGRLAKDKKAVQGTVHFVLTDGIGRTRIVSGVAEAKVRAAIHDVWEG